MTKRRQRLDGIVDFPYALPVSDDALGRELQTRIANRAVTISLPIMDRDTRRLMAPTSASAGTRKMPVATSFEWGLKSSAGPYYVAAAKISALFSMGRGIDWDVLEVASFAEEFESWFEVVHRWAEAWLGNPVRHIGASSDPIMRFAYKGDNVRSAVRTPVLISGPKFLSFDQLSGAFARASRGERPPAPYSFAMSAWVAHLEDDTRRAVIDAGTSVEVALSLAIAAQLRTRGNPESFINKIIIKANGMVGLYELWTSLGNPSAVSKSRITKQLAEIRNPAAHGGKAPTAEQAEKAIEIAREIVYEVCPIPEK